MQASPQVGDRVRVQLPNWDGPGCLVYTVEGIEGDVVTLREPRVPGLDLCLVRLRPDKLVAA